MLNYFGSCSSIGNILLNSTIKLILSVASGKKDVWLALKD
jgi:hypothetical protein